MGRRFTFLALLPFLSACIEFQPFNTIAWSPSGRELVFVANGSHWLYAFSSREVLEIAPELLPGVLAWSPQDDLIAVSSGSVVGFLRRGPSGFRLQEKIELGTPPAGAMPLFSWHPDGTRLLVALVGDKTASTTEIAVDAATAAHVGAGVGVYGPGGEWTFWFGQLAIGRQKERLVFDRQASDGTSLPIAPEDQRAVDLGAFSLLSAPPENSPWPLCVAIEITRKPASTDVRCFDREGRLRPRGRLPVAGNIFPDWRRELFALASEREDKSVRVAIYDAKGKLRTEGRALSAAIEKGVPRRAKNRRGSRLAWSPDGNWIAWVLDETLLLWNWRNDLVQVFSPS